MIKINSLEVENVKRVKAVRLEPTPSGLTIIGGKNGQGKTSILDSVAWLFGGNKFKPSDAKREGSMVDPILHAVLSNGLVVERKGVNSALKVIDPQGNKSGQQLLDEFIEELALDLPKFMKASSKEKANILLQIIGVGDKLHALDVEESQLYNRRTEIGRIADQKKKFAAEMTSYPEAPKELVSASELIKKQQDILARNGENQRKRDNIEYLRNRHKTLGETISDLKSKLDELINEQNSVYSDLEIAHKSAQDLIDESTTELEESIANIDAINVKVRANYDKGKAEIDAEDYHNQYNDLTAEIEKVRQNRIDLLKTAKLPLEDLSVENGELVYKGFKWDNMSGSEQLKVATAIVRKLNPNCGFVLIDKLEQMDMDTLKEFGAWLETEGLQVIATRVTTSKNECAIIIEDGYIKEELAPVMPEPKNTWERGKF
ncbi:MAG TPA: AAA family ATPase [Methylomusa anaerophila]|uniref:Chromosome segregation protein n=1 Tax=Methylomusa anaerophila TaxID=1930071 RepID=A0A348AIY0_9FIRM|nr:AAA family ATPase [Methylomusa anaerophila]BBB91028.1 chromosome segregation protein [Methylomusa anaerophila]HML88898.1 AAA family ATPase [Methylomusa anaerophila]